jgi:hypothetical protein
MKRKRGGSKRLDLAPLREILKDRRCWVCMGLVTVPDGESSHYEILTTPGRMDVLVEVETQPEGLDLTCRLNDAAIYRIPNVGDEVAIVIPAGEFDFMPIIVTTMASGTVPDGVAPNVTVIANGEVLIHDGAGGAVPLCLKSDFDGHTHAGALGGTGSAPALTSGPTANPAGTPPVDAVGTTILKAK